MLDCLIRPLFHLYLQFEALEIEMILQILCRIVARL